MRMIVNQLYTNSANVLAAALLFIRKIDNDLLRLTDYWRPIEDGMALYDSFNCQIVRIGRAVPSQDVELDKTRFFNVDGDWYECDDQLSRVELDDAVQILNDVYGDSFIIHPSPIGYAYYLA